MSQYIIGAEIDQLANGIESQEADLHIDDISEYHKWGISGQWRNEGLANNGAGN